MASRKSRKKPYDTDNPSNWTAAQLRSELDKLGLHLNSSVPRTALKQIYDQISKTSNNAGPRENASDTNQESSAANRIQRRAATELIDHREAADMGTNRQNNNITAVPDPLTGQNDNTSRNQLLDRVTSTNVTPVTPVIVTSAASSNDVTTVLVQNTLGMMSTMQTAITSLQSTVNTLVAKQSATGPDPKNNLETFYNAVPGTEQPVTTGLSTTNHGVPADELPHIDIVTESVKRNIIAGKYVNLACLLIPNFEAPKASTEALNGLEFLKRDRKDHRLDRALNISQFYKAFGIYKRIMSEAYPLRRKELDLYEADIGNIFEHYGDVFYQYHVQFSKQAAAYLEKGIKVDWSKRHKDLFQLIVGGAKTKVCDHCGQADHQSPFCPSQIEISLPSGVRRPNEGARSNVKRDPTHDKQGRLRIVHQGREICNNFNSVRGCTKSVCNFLHICTKCRKTGHGEGSCETHSKLVPSVTIRSDKTKKSE